MSSTEHSTAKWWEKDVIYQVYPRSFQDSNGDGIGDLKGIASRLNYLQDLGVGVIWLSPIYKSPMRDFGYDVSDHCDVDPIFGTMADFDTLMNEVHNRGMKLVMDFVPNHTSDLHRWFQESKKSRDNDFADFYVWHDGKLDKNGKRCPPNNWVSVFDGSMWEWCEDRQQYYLHQFLKEQPDLNYRNPAVREAMKSVLRFWFDRGVDGFRVDAIGCLFECPDLSDEPVLDPDCPPVVLQFWFDRGVDVFRIDGVPHLIEDAKFEDEPVRHPVLCTPDRYGYHMHTKTHNLPEIQEVLDEWCQLALEISEKTPSKPRFLLYEIYEQEGTIGRKDLLKYYNHSHGAPFNFELIDMPHGKVADLARKQIEYLKKHIVDWLEALPSGERTFWVIGNHDRKRIASIVGEHNVNVTNTLIQLMPGTPVTYQGEELGLPNRPISLDDAQDPFGTFGHDEKHFEDDNRDAVRTPMLWDSTKNAGFSSGTPWLPVHDNFANYSVETQQKSREKSTPLKVYKELLKLRKDAVFRNGDFKLLPTTHKSICFLRRFSEDTRLVALNYSKDNLSLNLSEACLSREVPVSATVVFSSCRSSEGTASLEKIELKPSEALVLKF